MINNVNEIRPFNHNHYNMKKIINTDKAPAPIGPYNQAILLGETLYISGQIAINPNTGNLQIDNIENETELVMSNLKAILEAANMTFDHVIKSSIFVSDMQNFSRIKSLFGRCPSCKAFSNVSADVYTGVNENSSELSEEGRIWQG